jgi:hypothetical protein
MDMTVKTTWIKIVKLDRRYRGYRQFKFLIEFVRRGFLPQNNDRLKNFLKVREWCQDTWGHTCERDFHIRLSEDITKSEIEYKTNPHWAWHSTNNGVFRIYFKDQQELDMFTLRWFGQ